MQQETFATLVNELAREGRSFARAELALLKLEARETAILGVSCLVMVLVSAMALVTAIALAAAAWVLALQGGAVAALLTAAGVQVAMAAVASSLTLLKLRSPRNTRAALPALEYSPGEAS